MTMHRSICAVIPAAGRGSRLGMDVPKFLVPLDPDQTVWDVLYATIAPWVQHVQVILHPSMVTRFETHLLAHPPEPTPASYALQETPRGMGNAIFSGYSTWQQFTDILVVWGDQVFVSQATIENTLLLQHAARPPALSLPLCRQAVPYVEYIFNDGQQIVRVLQSREGDACRPNGLSDVGVFALSTRGIAAAWQVYQGRGERGTQTGELNFLPFLSYLSTCCAWQTQCFEIEDVRESRGINTPEDLAFFRQLLASQRWTGVRGPT
jgi:bifunctional UDP-N-acetylglucosamine pyrophosphorylase / glucosamine-1-phosphate N-acetyltransferase